MIIYLRVIFISYILYNVFLYVRTRIRNIVKNHLLHNFATRLSICSIITHIR